MQSDVCPLCGNDEESLYHTPLSCDHARRFWEATETHFSINAPKLQPIVWATDGLDPSIVAPDKAATMVTIMCVWGGVGGGTPATITPMVNPRTSHISLWLSLMILCGPLKLQHISQMWLPRRMRNGPSPTGMDQDKHRWGNR